MRIKGKADVKTPVQANRLAPVGERKVLIALVAMVGLVIGLVLVLAFKQLTVDMWKAWCYGMAGSGGLYMTANVVSKFVDKEK